VSALWRVPRLRAAAWLQVPMRPVAVSVLESSQAPVLARAWVLAASQWAAVRPESALPVASVLPPVLALARLQAPASLQVSVRASYL
jgi:hypothetical protein